MKDSKLQGSLEYLLLIGGVIIVAIIVIIFAINAANIMGGSIIDIAERNPTRCEIRETQIVDITSEADIKPLNNPLTIPFNVSESYSVLKAKIVWSSSQDWQTTGFCRDTANNPADCWHCFWIDGSSIASAAEEPDSKEIEIAGISFLDKSAPHFLTISSGINSGCNFGNENDDFILNDVALEIEVCMD